MKVYVVGYTTAYDGGDIAGVYSTRELAEASWEYRNDDPVYRDYDILEFDLDFDSKAKEPDIDRRPMYGPKTHGQHVLNESIGRMFSSNLFAPNPLPVKSLPLSKGNTVKFYSYPINPENGQEK